MRSPASLARLTYFTLEITAIHFIRAVTAIVVVIASPLIRYTLGIRALEFGLRARSIRAMTKLLCLVRVVATVVFEVT